MPVSTAQIVAKAESYAGIRAGVAGLAAVLNSPSYQTAAGTPTIRDAGRAAQSDTWPSHARNVLVLGLHHPEDDPRLDYWDRGDTRGNRRLREISKELQYWLRWTYHEFSHPLPYNAKNGGVFLKDAAVLSGLGVIGRNNLLLHPEWGPRIRLRAVLLEGEYSSIGPLEGFAPCQACRVFCWKACPQTAFPRGAYSRPLCSNQMNTDLKNRISLGEDDQLPSVTSHCRACELSCPVGV